jgi:proline dehydrogenase
MRALLLYLARMEGFKNLMLKFGMFRKLASRFVAGETLDDAVRVVKETNRTGVRGTLDLLGENTLSLDDARSATREIIGILDRIRSEHIDCNVSVKLTQLGLGLDTEQCLGNLSSIVAHARQLGDFVRVDMEDSDYTESTLDLVRRVYAEMDNVGTVLQACLYRSENDAKALVQQGIRIRLCKGAYLEPDTVAFRKKADTDASFVRIMKLLLDSGLYHAIATHDEAIIAATRAYAEARKAPRDAFEFQMLYGIRRDLQQELVRDGYVVRIYIPYGVRWYPYLMRRLAERPANLMFIARNIFRG